jgi:hypothetical protein
MIFIDFIAPNYFALSGFHMMVSMFHRVQLHYESQKLEAGRTIIRTRLGSENSISESPPGTAYALSFFTAFRMTGPPWALETDLLVLPKGSRLLRIPMAAWHPDIVDLVGTTQRAVTRR